MKAFPAVGTDGFRRFKWSWVIFWAISLPVSGLSIFKARQIGLCCSCKALSKIGVLVWSSRNVVGSHDPFIISLCFSPWYAYLYSGIIPCQIILFRSITLAVGSVIFLYKLACSLSIKSGRVSIGFCFRKVSEEVSRMCRQGSNRSKCQVHISKPA